MKQIFIGVILTLALNLAFADQAQNSNSQQGSVPHNVPAAIKPKPGNSPAKAPQKAQGHSISNTAPKAVDQNK